MAVSRVHRLGCVVLVVAFSHIGRPAHAQSLVDAARLAGERRAELGPPAKVYTTADLPNTTRLTEPTLAWASRYRSLLEAARERERALREELLRERALTLSLPTPAPVPPKTVPTDAPPTPPRAEIPWYLVSSGYSVPVAGPPDPQPRHDTVAASSRPYRRGGRARDRRSRARTTPRQATSDKRADPSADERGDAPTRHPAARNASAQPSRAFRYIAPSLPAPGVARTRTDGRATLP